MKDKKRIESSVSFRRSFGHLPGVKVSATFNGEVQDIKKFNVIVNQMTSTIEKALQKFELDLRGEDEPF